MTAKDVKFKLRHYPAYLFLWKAANFNYLYPFADKRLRGAIPYLERAILLSPRFPYAYGFKAFMYRNFGEYDSSIMAGKELLKFGDQWKGEAYKHMASTYFLKAYFKDSTNQSIIDSADMLFTLILNDTINFPLKSLNPFRNFNMMGDFFKWRRNFPKAIAAYDLSAYLKPTSAYSQIGLAMCYALENNKEKAIEHLRKALEKNDKFLDYKRLKEETDLDNLRTTPEFKALMKKYFPDEYK